MKIDVINVLKTNRAENNKSNKKQDSNFEQLLSKVTKITNNNQSEVKVASKIEENNNSFENQKIDFGFSNETIDNNKEKSTQQELVEDNSTNDLLCQLKSLVENLLMNQNDNSKNQMLLLDEVEKIDFLPENNVQLLNNFKLNMENQTALQSVSKNNDLHEINNSLLEIFKKLDVKNNDGLNIETLKDIRDKINEILNNGNFEQDELKSINNLFKKLDLNDSSNINEGNISAKITKQEKSIDFKLKGTDITITSSISEDIRHVPINSQEAIDKEIHEDFKVDNESYDNLPNTLTEINNRVESTNTKEISFKELQTEVEKIITPQKTNEIIQIAVDRFKTLRLPDLTEVRVKLKPEELGEITVKVVLEKGEVKGNIIVEKKEIAYMIQNQIDNLKQELKNNNVNISNITINLSNDNLNERSGHGFKHQGGQGKGNYKETLSDFEKVFEKEEGLNIIA